MFYKITLEDVHSDVYSSYDDADVSLLSIIPTSSGLDNIELTEYADVYSIPNGSVLAIGKIEPNDNVEGKLTIKAFICSDYIGISDTVNFGRWNIEPTDEMVLKDGGGQLLQQMNGIVCQVIHYHLKLKLKP